MKFEELLDYAKTEHKRIIDHFGIEGDSKTKFLIFTKLVEEIGEVSEALNHLDKIGRSEKLTNKKTNIESELADIISATLILAQELNIDIETALTEKIAEIKARKY